MSARALRHGGEKLASLRKNEAFNFLVAELGK
jgi:hypothetical protein